MVTKMRNKRGFTLLELILVVVIMGLISVVLGRFLIQSFRLFDTSNNVAQVDLQGFYALERMVNDIHNIRSPSDITGVSPSALSFVDMNGTAISYQLTATNLTRNTIPIASGVQSFSVSYLNENGAATAVASTVRFFSLVINLKNGNYATSFTTLAGTRLLD